MENKNLLLVVLIAALLVVVGLQTVQLALSTGAGVSFPASSGTKPSSTGAASGAPTSLDQLQGMVGGC